MTFRMPRVLFFLKAMAFSPWIFSVGIDADQQPSIVPLYRSHDLRRHRFSSQPVRLR
jgi:hypothetical protein